MIRLILFGCLVIAMTAMTADTTCAQNLLAGLSYTAVDTTVSADRLTLTGAVEIDSGVWRLYADDEVVIFTNESRLIASGNVVFISEGGQIAASRVEFDLDSRTGTFYDAVGSTQLVEDIELSMFGSQEPEMRFGGEIVEILGPRKYHLTRGWFTACIQPTPRWEVSVTSLTLNLDEYAVMRNAVLKVKGVPVFYLPAMYYPIQEDGRATGLLMPTYGASTIRGQSLSNAFFMAFNRSHDSTLYHDWFASAGQGYGADYSYALGQGSGSANVYQLNENETTFVDAFGGETTTPGRRSFNLTGNMRHRISNSLRARGQIDYFSDVTVQQTYQTNIYDASNTSRTYGGNLTGSWGSYTASGTAEFSETFFGSTESALNGTAPRLRFDQNARSLGGSPFYFSFGSEYAKLLRSTNFEDSKIESGLTRFDVNPTVRLPFTHWPFLTVNTSFAWRQTYWTESFDEAREQVPTSISRSFVELETTLTGPALLKVWDTPNSGYSERMKHVIEPWLSLSRTSAIDNFDQIVRIEGIDSIVGGVTQISYGLSNRLYAKRAEGGGPAVAREILSVSLDQSYYTDADAAEFDRQFQTSFQGTAPTHFSPVSLTMRAEPTSELSGSLRAEYDTQFGAVRTISANAGVEFSGWLHQTAGWSLRRFVDGLAGFDDPDGGDHYLNSYTSLRTRDNRIGGVYQFNYDVQRQKFLQQTLLGYYNTQCCGISFEYQSYNLEGLGLRVETDRRFNLSFTLAGLGSFSNMLGAFGVGQGVQELR